MRHAMLMVVGVVVGVAAGPCANAQPQTGLFKWEVSSDGGGSWYSSITVSPGEAYKIRAWASWTDGPVRSVGFAAVEFEQIDLIGADATDVFGGVSGSGEPGYIRRVQGDPRRLDDRQTWLLGPGSGASQDGLKIDTVSPPGYLYLLQLPKILETAPGGTPYSGFDASNPMQLFEMGAVAGDPKLLTISATWHRRASGGGPVSNLFGVYTTDSGIWKKPAQEAVMENATVRIVPGGGGVMLIGAGLAAMWRRRRG